MASDSAIELQVDSAPARAALQALVDVAQRRLEAVQGFLCLGHALIELRRVDAGNDAALTGELAFRLEPSERLREFLGADLVAQVVGRAEIVAAVASGNQRTEARIRDLLRRGLL